MKRLAVISLLTLSISLTGCSSLLNLLSGDSSNMKFEDKGEKVQRSTWLENFEKASKNSNLNTNDTIKSYKISTTTKLKNTQEENNNNGKYSAEVSGTGKATYQYDADSYLYSYKSSSETKQTTTTPYGKGTEKGNNSEGKFYQMDYKTLYTIDTVAKTYTTTTGDQTAEQAMNQRAAEGINSTILLFALFAAFDTTEQYDYYQNEEVFTINYVTKDDEKILYSSTDSSKKVGSTVTNGEMTLQLNLTSGKNSFKYSIKSEVITKYTDDDLNKGYKAGDSIKETSLTTFNADIKFQEQRMNAMSLSGYTKLD